MPAIKPRKAQHLHFSLKILLIKADNFESLKHADITQTGTAIILLEAVPAMP